MINYQNSRNLNMLLDSMRKKPLALFIGAGVNVPIVPVWTNLLNDVLNKVIKMKYTVNGVDKTLMSEITEWYKSDALSVYEKASLIKQLLQKQYLYFLKDILYGNNSAKPSDLFGSVVKLCADENVKAVVTYNYDDYLMSDVSQYRSIRIETGQYASVPSLPSFSNQPVNNGLKDILPFYYVHGHIPRIANDLSLAKTNIVLSYDEYFNNMMDPYSWQTTTQIYFLRNYTCLFIGVSLSDWNMLRLIQTANHTNNSVYTLMAQPSILKGDSRLFNDFQKNSIISAKETILSGFGVRLILCGPEYNDIAKTVDNITYILTH